MASDGLVSRSVCGTFGCILPNNHLGLHQLPAAPSKRQAPALQRDSFEYEPVVKKRKGSERQLKAEQQDEETLNALMKQAKD